MPKKKKYAEKNIVVEVPEDVESVTTVASTTDEEVSVIYAEDPDPTLVRLAAAEENIEGLKDLLESLVESFNALVSTVERHIVHLPVPGPSTTPRRHDTYEVREDGEKLARIAKNLWGVSGRYVEIAALNDITDATNLKKGQVLKLPK